MKRSEYQELLEAARRRRLTAEEEARLQTYLAAHPQAQREWDEEQALDQMLGQLNDVPVSTNFTARVLEAVHRENLSAPALIRGAWFEKLVSFFRGYRIATATAIVAIGLIMVQQYRHRERARVVESLATLPNFEALQDFDAIARLGQVRGSADEDLLAALQ